MIVDSSALIAVAAGESTAAALRPIFNAGYPLVMSSATYLETFLVADRHPNPMVARKVEALINLAQITVEPFTAAQAQLARQAYRDFGKGSGHPAGLNFGDCFSYALAIDTDQPLLFLGNDFSHTDVRIAEY